MIKFSVDLIPNYKIYIIVLSVKIFVYFVNN